MKYCTSCGKELKDQAKFCTGCGAKCDVDATKNIQPIQKSVGPAEPRMIRSEETAAQNQDVMHEQTIPAPEPMAKKQTVHQAEIPQAEPKYQENPPETAKRKKPKSAKLLPMKK